MKDIYEFSWGQPPTPPDTQKFFWLDTELNFCSKFWGMWGRWLKSSTSCFWFGPGLANLCVAPPMSHYLHWAGVGGILWPQQSQQPEGAAEHGNWQNCFMDHRMFSLSGDNQHKSRESSNEKSRHRWPVSSRGSEWFIYILEIVHRILHLTNPFPPKTQQLF